MRYTVCLVAPACGEMCYAEMTVEAESEDAAVVEIERQASAGANPVWKYAGKPLRFWDCDAFVTAITPSPHS